MAWYIGHRDIGMVHRARYLSFLTMAWYIGHRDIGMVHRVRYLSFLTMV